MAQDTIQIKNLLVRGILGVNDWERTNKQDILLNVTMFTDVRSAGASDELDESINYRTVAKAVVSHVESATRFTVEALATDLAKMCLDLSGVDRVRVRVEKPGAVRFAESVGVEIERSPQDFVERAFISIGSNINPEHYIRLAAGRLAEVGKIRAISRVYENPAFGPKGQPDFLNAAALVETDLSLDELLMRLSEIEDALGRVRTADAFSPRTIDLDVCLFGAIVRESPRPVLPDPDILTRGYLAITLAELDPDFRHPVTGESLRELAARMRTDARLNERSDVLDSITP